ncbi:MAG: DNA primase [Patescibacteria group bacterium]|nr:DNA primase [Patescibacteria group bacterium]
MSSVIDEIKSKLDIVDVLSEYIQLKQAGANFRAVCPFHREKTPSFFISPERQIWHCFGCGKGGDIFGFIREIEGVEFPEALRILAQRAGVKIEKYNQAEVSQKTKLQDICSISAKFYHKILLESSSAEKARQYLKERELDQKTIAEFQLGFAPEKGNLLLEFLSKRGYKPAEIEASGMIIKSTHQSSYYDRFRSRIMFPIFNLFGQVVGFTGRVMPAFSDQLADTAGRPVDEQKEVAKYINTPETQIYSKSRVLYGLDKAKLEIKLQDFVILVEGNMDVIACHQFGTKNVVCTSGTALTSEQIKLLKRYTPNIILAFDVDLAGQNATQGGIDLLLQEDLNVKILHLLSGKDPDECIRKTPEIWQKAIKEPLPIMEYYFSSAIARVNPDSKILSIENKKQVSQILLPFIAKLGSPVEQGLWVKKLSNDLDISEISLHDALKKIKLPQKNKEKDNSEANEKPSSEEQVGDMLLGLILKYPEKGEIASKLIFDMFIRPRAQTLAKIIKECYIKNNKIEVDQIKEEFKDKDSEYIDFLFFLIEKEFAGQKDKEIEKEFNNLFRILKKRHLEKRREKVMLELKEAEKNKDKEMVEKIIREITELSHEINVCDHS